MSGAKKIFLVALLLVGLVAAYFWVHQAGQYSTGPANEGRLDRPLVVGIVSWPGYTGGIVANDGFESGPKSIFVEKYGLKVKFVLLEDVDARGKAFVRGGPEGLDVIWSTVDFFANEASNFQNNQVHPVAIMQVDWSQGGDALVAGPEIKTVEDLRKKRIALVQFTPSNWLLENILKDSKLSPDEQNSIRQSLVFTQDVPSARQAFVAGRVDAAVLWEPDVSQALEHKPGSHILVSTADKPKMIADLMITKKEFADAYPRTLEAFVRGWLDGVARARQDPDHAADLLLQNETLFKDLGHEKTRKALTWVKLTDLDDNVEMFGLDGRSPQFDQIFSQAGSLWKERGYVSKTAEPSSVKEDRFLRSIYGAKGK